MRQFTVGDFIILRRIELFHKLDKKRQRANDKTTMRAFPECLETLCSINERCRHTIYSLTNPDGRVTMFLLIKGNCPFAMAMAGRGRGFVPLLYFFKTKQKRDILCNTSWNAFLDSVLKRCASPHHTSSKVPLGVFSGQNRRPKNKPAGAFSSSGTTIRNV